jgi:hypothetical protein
MRFGRIFPSDPRGSGPGDVVDDFLKTAGMLWRGEMPLRPVFWIYGFAVVLVFKWSVRALSDTGWSQNPIYFVTVAAAAAYSVFIVIAVWRSAARFEGEKFWAYAARAVIVLWPPTIFWGP